MRMKYRLRCLALSCVYTFIVGAAELRAIIYEMRSDTHDEEADCNLGINIAVATLKLTIGVLVFINYVLVHRVFCHRPGVFWDPDGLAKWRTTRGTPDQRYRVRRAYLGTKRKGDNEPTGAEKYEEMPRSITFFRHFIQVLMCTQICLGLVAATYAPSAGQPDWHAPLDGLCVITTLQINYVLGTLLWTLCGVVLSIWWNVRASEDERQAEKHEANLKRIHSKLLEPEPQVCPRIALHTKPLELLEMMWAELHMHAYGYADLLQSNPQAYLYIVSHHSTTKLFTPSTTKPPSTTLLNKTFQHEFNCTALMDSSVERG